MMQQLIRQTELKLEAARADYVAKRQAELDDIRSAKETGGQYKGNWEPRWYAECRVKALERLLIDLREIAKKIPDEPVDKLVERNYYQPASGDSGGRTIVKLEKLK